MFRIQKLLSCILVATIATISSASPVAAGQSDISLFAGGGRLPPNIMIMLDSSSSMNDPPSSGGIVTKADIADAAIVNVINSINPLDGGNSHEENARFGLFGFRGNGGRLHSSLAAGNTTNVIAQVQGGSSTNVGTPLNGAILDIGRYFATGSLWGTLPAWGSRGGETPVPDPFDFECRDSFTIFISDGDPRLDAVVLGGFWDTIGDNDGDGGVGEGDPETLANVGNEDVQWTDDIAKAMFDRDFSPTLEGKQNVVTHVIGFDTDGTNLQRMAEAGGGIYRTTTTATGLEAALAEVVQVSFDSLASYSTAVVPTSRTAFGSSFYNAYFEPRADEAFWEGHIEAYDISPSGEILGASGSPAIDPLTDELFEPHDYHWDAGERLRSNTTRDLYTTISNARTDLAVTASVTAALGITLSDVSLFPNSASSGITTTTQAESAVLSYLRGRDAFDEDTDGDYTELRDKVLGDVFHSTPVIVGAPSSALKGEPGYSSFYTNYVTRSRRLYAGANDGMLHGFDAGSLTTGDNPLTAAVETAAVFYTPGSGDEVFGYVPGLLLDKVKLVPRNNPRTFYFVDGSPVVADAWLRSGSSDYTRGADEWTTAMITPFREGGRGYLALDVTDPAATNSLDAHGPYPKFLWEFTDSTLGETWSEPVVTRVRVEEGLVGDVCGADDGDGNCRERWVAIFGGGYEVTADPNHADFAGSSGNAGWTVRSKAIYMVDIATGVVLDKIEYDSVNNPDMLYSLPSKPAVLDLDFDGFADVVYIGDLGGQVWKWDISAIGDDSSGSDGIIDNWSHGLFFSTPATGMTGGIRRYRSFFFPPTASLVRGTLFLGFASGEREQLDYGGDPSRDENNRVYVVKDYFPTGASAFSSIAAESDLTDITSIPTDNDPSDLGYMFVGNDGEKFVSELIVFAGYVIAVGFEVDAFAADPCEATTGISKLYAFDLDTGQGYFTGGSPATPMEERYVETGGGMASTPQISIAPDPDDDKMYIKTSKGRVITIDPPPRPDSGASLIYWKQNQ
jgi:type IV pilus assembly protein PilY1